MHCSLVMFSNPNGLLLFCCMCQVVPVEVAALVAILSNANQLTWRTPSADSRISFLGCLPVAMRWLLVLSCCQGFIMKQKSSRKQIVILKVDHAPSASLGRH